MHKGRDHVEFVGVGLGKTRVLVLVVLQRRQVGQLVPLDLTDLLPRARFEMGVPGHPAEDKQLHVLLPHGDLDGLHFLLIWDQPSLTDIISCLLIDFPNRAI
jgi:hypothetical protein